MKSIREALNRRQNGEAGFTLVEMLVVIVIVGILAAVAIPIYMNQRKKAWISTVESDVKSAAVAVSTEVAKNGTTNIAATCTGGTTGKSEAIGEEQVNCSAGVTIEVAVDKADSDNFTVTGTHEKLGGNLIYDFKASTYTNSLS